MLSIARPDYKEHIEVQDAINSDIRDILQKNFKRNVKEVQPFAKYFKGATEYETARNIWTFLKKGIRYKKDAAGFQDIRLGRRFFTDKTGDCKSYALNAISLFRAIYPGSEVAFKFTTYVPGKRIPSHVYAVVKDSSGREIIVDGCWTKFDNEKNYTFSLPINFMTVRTLSDDISGDSKFAILYDRLPRAKQIELKSAIARRAKFNSLRMLQQSGKVSTEKALHGISEIESELDGIGKLTKEQRKERRKKRMKKFKEGLKKFGRGLNFINLAPVRGAFLAVLAMNLNGLASNIKIAKDMKDQKGWKKIIEFWKNTGGIPKVFIKAMNAGTKHKPLWMSKKSKARYQKRIDELKKSGKISGFDESIYDGGLTIEEYCEECGVNGIGAFPLAAVIALATTLISGIIAIVMKAIKGHPKAEAAAEATAQEIVENPNQYKQAFDNNEGVKPGDMPEGSSDGMEGIGNLDWYKDLVQDDVSGIGAMDSDTQNNLFSSLGKVFAVGTEFVGNVIAKKAKKNKKLASALKGGDEYYASKLSKDAGFRPYPRGGGGGGIPKPVVYGGLALLGLLVLKKLNIF